MKKNKKAQKVPAGLPPVVFTPDAPPYFIGRSPMGYLAMNGLAFPIEELFMAGGELVVKATAGTAVAHQFTGCWTVYGRDGCIAYQGDQNKDFGIKTAYSVWKLDYRLQMSSLSDTLASFREWTERQR